MDFMCDLEPFSEIRSHIVYWSSTVVFLYLVEMIFFHYLDKDKYKLYPQCKCHILVITRA